MLLFMLLVMLNDMFHVRLHVHRYVTLHVILYVMGFHYLTLDNWYSCCTNIRQWLDFGQHYISNNNLWSSKCIGLQDIAIVHQAIVDPGPLGREVSAPSGCKWPVNDHSCWEECCGGHPAAHWPLYLKQLNFLVSKFPRTCFPPFPSFVPCQG